MINPNAEYIGDGVYAFFDGYRIWLQTERDNGVHEIALEPPVLAELNRVVERIKIRDELS